jgi:hypothetical protein
LTPVSRAAVRRDSPVYAVAGVALCGNLLFAAAVQAQGTTAPDTAQLANDLSNPIADLVSVPFQFNWGS